MLKFRQTNYDFYPPICLFCTARNLSRAVVNLENSYDDESQEMSKGLWQGQLGEVGGTRKQTGHTVDTAGGGGRH